jgi:hypothetical protein
LKGKTTTDYFDFAILISNSQANKPIEELDKLITDRTTAVWQNGGFSAKFKFSSSVELLCKTEHLCLDFRHFAKLQNVN